MTGQTFEWLHFLTVWNAELLTSRMLAEIRRRNPSDDLDRAIANGWLGYPGASETEIAEVEARLGVILPPSYRAFLATSNGWRWPELFIPKVWSTNEIEWLVTRHQDGITAWREGEQAYADTVIPDEEYLIYGDEQQPTTMRSQYLQTALDISDVEIAGTAQYILNPQVSHDGEWEAWFWAHWLPGAERYRSFQELMQARYASFRSMEQDGPFTFTIR